MYNSVYTINADISSVDSPHKLTFYKREHRYQSVMIVCSSELGSVNFSDSYAVVAGIKPDNTNIYDPCIIFGNCIQFSLTEQMTAVAGTYLLDVLIKKDGDDTYRDVACQLEFVIQNGSFDDDITSSSEYQAVTDIESAAMANVKQWVIDNTGDLFMKANINSPSFTGTPTSITPITTDNSTKIATTAYVNALIESAITGGSW